MESATFPTPEAHQPSVLLVDDEDNILASLRRLLRKDGYRILSARSGAEALELLKQDTHIDVILSDQRMPGMTGTEFLQQALKFSPHSIRIILSGYTDLESVTRAINDGAVYKFLTKPWDDDLLRLSVREALRQKWLLDENRMLQAMQTEIAAEFAGKIETQNQVLNTLNAHLKALPLPLLVIDQHQQLCAASELALQLLQLDANMLPLPPPLLPASLANGASIELQGRAWRSHHRAASTEHPFDLILLSPETPAC